ncbi:unnamed protein product [Callosobruchus maculatus]|uniref:Uncharacterized protein n=1 Tax=Callosobruchus maculatus TaxID=64391 RepID=A0A653DPY2_CALMS|nr:unnamed protein product [Callosobruchus maculatus]
MSQVLKLFSKVLRNQIRKKCDQDVSEEQTPDTLQMEMLKMIPQPVLLPKLKKSVNPDLPLALSD